MINIPTITGVHHRSTFNVEDQNGEIAMRVLTKDLNELLVDFDAEETGEGEFPQDSIFSSVKESSDFFESGCVGYSSRPDSCKLDGLLLKVENWRVSSLKVSRVRSSYFDDQIIFPERSIHFDHALLMRDILHEWHSEPMMARE